MTLAELGESGLVAHIERLFRPATALPVGIGDDGAVLPPSRGPIVAVADALVEGVHFRRDLSPPEAIGRKVVAVNVSDIAAMGAIAEYGLLTASLPGATNVDWILALLRGVADEARRHSATIVGGDVTGSTGPVSLSLSMLGRLAGTSPLLRSGAQPGDSLYVTGVLGTSGLGLRRLLTDPAASGPDVDAYRAPSPRTAEGAALGAWGRCHALMDLSDGLGVDAPRMAAASGVTLVIDLERLPAAPGADESLALFGGEDYELLFACEEPPPVAATVIGRVEAGVPGVRWLRGGAVVVPNRDDEFRHF